MANSDHVGWLREGHVRWNERRRLISFRPDLSGLNFKDTAMGTPGFFRRFNFSRADLTGARFGGLDFSKAIFRDSILKHADLDGARFDGADFRGSDLTGARATYASFVGAKLQGVDLRETNVEGARFLPNEIDDLRILPSQHQTLDHSFAGWIEFDPLSGPPVLDSPPSSKGGAGASPEGEPAYLVIFATNRKPSPGGAGVGYSNERGEQLSFGSCQVLVPQSHEVGSIGSPFYKRLFKGDDRLKIRKLVTLNGELHWELVRRNFSQAAHASPPTVFIHGYNTTFQDAVLWAAQLGFDLGLKRGANLFSWASAGVKGGYLTDEGTVEWSKYHLAEYLLEFAKQCEGVGINIVAHSMGCRCLVLALELIGLRHPDALRKFNHIFLAAADVDQGAMRSIGAHTVGNSGMTTSYVCGKDVTLSLSGWAHHYARVGLLPPVFLLGEIDTVEVEKANLLSLGHGYVSTARSVLTDIFEVIRHSTKPHHRFSVYPTPDGASTHWKLRE